MKLVFIHGAYSGAWSFNFLKIYLSSFKKQYFLSYNCEDSFQKIISKLKEDLIRIDRSGEPIVLIGHSYGGTLAYYLAHVLKIKNIVGVVSLSSPHGGIDGAGYVNPFIVKMFMPKNNFWKNIHPLNDVFTSLKTSTFALPSLCVVVKTNKTRLITADDDGIVSVKSQTSLGIRDNLEYFEIDGLHMSGCLDERVVEKIKFFLNSL